MIIGESPPISAMQFIKDVSAAPPVRPLSLRSFLLSVKPKPLPPVNLKPNGETASRTPTFSWIDPGAGRPEAAEDFLVECLAGAGYPAETTKTSYTVNQAHAFPYSAKIAWRVRARNFSGNRAVQSEWSQQATFKVQDAPLPPSPKNMQYTLYLDWQAPFPVGKMYVMGYMTPVPNGVLTKVRNVSVQFMLWFPTKPGASTDDAFDPSKGLLLDVGKEATAQQLNWPTSLNNGLTVVATPSPIGGVTQGVVAVQLFYTVPA
jgi:hypothetical protein